VNGCDGRLIEAAFVAKAMQAPSGRMEATVLNGTSTMGVATGLSCAPTGHPSSMSWAAANTALGPPRDAKARTGHRAAATKGEVHRNTDWRIITFN
jgi:hypothetical protein